MQICSSAASPLAAVTIRSLHGVIYFENRPDPVHVHAMINSLSFIFSNYLSTPREIMFMFFYQLID